MGCSHSEMLSISIHQVLKETLPTYYTTHLVHLVVCSYLDSVKHNNKTASLGKLYNNLHLASISADSCAVVTFLICPVVLGLEATGRVCCHPHVTPVTLLNPLSLLEAESAGCWINLTAPEIGEGKFEEVNWKYGCYSNSAILNDEESL